VPRSRRKPDPRDVTAVLARLERLRAESSVAEPGAQVASAPDRSGAEPPSLRAALAARLPSSVRGGVLDPGRRGVAVLAVLALVGALAGAWYFVTAQPAAGSAKQPPPASGAPQRSGPTTDFSAWPTTPAVGSATAEPIVVDVVGKVVSPGVVELPPGSRIRDAVAAAGGALPGTDLTALDLASRLSDGQEVFVGIPPPTGAAAQAAGGVVGGDPGPADGNSGAGGGSSSSGVVSLNSATLAELETLPGVGPVLAQHIIDWRTQHGRFTAVTQLQQVSGIGPSKYAALAGRVKL